ncbi:MAG: WD40/YVTN/BNR-like repeat-containing protein [Longimicrobiales bacterium]
MRISRLLLAGALLWAGAAVATGSPLAPHAALAAQESPFTPATFRGMALREIGPALTSGRIIDLAVDPADPATYLVATAGGGVWRTRNGGTTFEPVFDNEGAASIGVVVLDPNNPHVVWVGTGENNAQRAVSYGDGVYKSVDGGSSWKKVGLERSEHIGAIVVDPRDSDVVYVAAQGPVWAPGGDRGLFKTTDGGKTWSEVLDVSEDTGVNEVLMDPRDPDVLYASAWQRRRHVWTYIGGGPESALHKSTDAGKSWEKITAGLPSGDVGRIGLCISPADPDYVYAMVEAAGDAGGFFRSTDRGGSFHKRSGYATVGLYYTEIMCDPFDRDRVVSMDVFSQVTEDGGATWGRYGEHHKHVDNHALWLDPGDPDHAINGNDGGVYETWDGAKTWHFKANLPVTQFYKVALDNALPFYNVYGGTQDNFSLAGPSRTTSQHGIVNEDWEITNGGDGFESQADPTDPNIVYAQSQYGGLVRYDKASGEIVPIQPQPGLGEPGLRWQWDAPLLISPHAHTRLYHAAQKVFRSDDRGNSWRVVSPDLTRQLDRNTFPVMGKVWSVDAVGKNASTTIYGNIVTLDESPLKEGLLIVGTDDGLVQVTEDGGANWRKIERFPGVPERTYVNMVLASRHDANTLFAAFNNHKNGDFKPYLLKSTDLGRTWTSIASDLPERGSVYSVAQDPEVAELLFAGTEFGAFFSRDGGGRWVKLTGGGFPVAAVRDLAIHPRENDLVLATFGRGFWVLDDYAPLREATAEVLAKDAHLFGARGALIYVPSRKLGLSNKSFQGESYYTAANPPFGAVVTYWLKDGIQTLEEKRQEAEKKLADAGQPVPYPSFEAMRAEDQEEDPYLLFTISDDEGNVVRRLKTAPRKGVNRIAWDLRWPAEVPVDLSGPGEENPFSDPDVGPLVTPGTYTVSLSKVVDGVPQVLAGPRELDVVPLNNATLAAEDKEALLAFQKEAGAAYREILAASRRLGDASGRIRHAKEAIRLTPALPEAVLADARALERRIAGMRITLSGDGSVAARQFETPPSIMDRIGFVIYASYSATQAPGEAQRTLVRDAFTKYRELTPQIDALWRDLEALEARLEAAGAPYTPNRKRGS